MGMISKNVRPVSWEILFFDESLENRSQARVSRWGVLAWGRIRKTRTRRGSTQRSISKTSFLGTIHLISRP